MAIENTMENETFAPQEQVLHFPQYVANLFKIELCLSLRYSSCTADTFIVNESKIST